MTDPPAERLFSGQVELRSGFLSRFRSRFLVLTSQELLWFDQQQHFTQGSPPARRLSREGLVVTQQLDPLVSLYSLENGGQTWQARWAMKDHAQPWMKLLGQLTAEAGAEGPISSVENGAGAEEAVSMVDASKQTLSSPAPQTPAGVEPDNENRGVAEVHTASTDEEDHSVWDDHGTEPLQLTLSKQEVVTSSGSGNAEQGRHVITLGKGTKSCYSSSRIHCVLLRRRRPWSLCAASVAGARPLGLRAVSGVERWMRPRQHWLTVGSTPMHDGRMALQ